MPPVAVFKAEQRRNTHRPMISRRSFFAAALALPIAAQQRRPFRWPAGKRAAISLTFDDARVSQIDTGIPLLERCGVKATFYLSPSNMAKRSEGWKQVAAAGVHEIGSHSYSHPCTANYRFTRSNALEDFTLARMEADIERGNEEIRRLVGVKPVSFAYPCGQKFVGRGEKTQSYVPLIAKRFLTGRGFLDESANDPQVCDLAALMGIAFDEMDYQQMDKIVQAAAQEGRWLIFAGHEIGKPGRQTTHADALEQLCRYAAAPANGLWIDTVERIARYVQAQQSIK